MGEDILAIQLVVQGIETIAGISLRFLRVMPFAASEHWLELIGCPISRSFATSRIGLELRPLSSTGITRLPRYYGPLRHPRVPGPSLTGVRLIVPGSHRGASRVARASLVYMLPPLPRHSDWKYSCSLFQPYQPSPIWPSGRPVQRPFRGLLGVHSRCGLHTRAVTVFRDTLLRRLQPLRYLHDCSGCFRLERLPGGTFTHWESAALARRTPITVVPTTQDGERFLTANFPAVAANSARTAGEGRLVAGAGFEPATFGL